MSVNNDLTNLMKHMHAKTLCSCIVFPSLFDSDWKVSHLWGQRTPNCLHIPLYLKGNTQSINLALHSLDLTNSKLLIGFALNAVDHKTQHCFACFLVDTQLSRGGKALAAEDVTTRYEQNNKLMELVAELQKCWRSLFEKMTLWFFVMTHWQMSTQTQSCDWLTFLWVAFVLLTLNINSTQN